MELVGPLFRRADTLLSQRGSYFRESLQYIAFVRATINEYESNLNDPGIDRDAVIEEIEQLKLRSRKRILAARAAVVKSQEMMWRVMEELNSILSTTDNANLASDIERAMLKYESALAHWLPNDISSAWNNIFV